MLALIPIIGPTLAIATIASWQIIKLLFILGGAGNPIGAVLPWISLAVWGLAF
jgi:hypothetical protein